MKKATVALWIVALCGCSNEPSVYTSGLPEEAIGAWELGLWGPRAEDVGRITLHVNEDGSAAMAFENPNYGLGEGITGISAEFVVVPDQTEPRERSGDAPLEAGYSLLTIRFHGMHEFSFGAGSGEHVPEWMVFSCLLSEEGDYFQQCSNLEVDLEDPYRPSQGGSTSEHYTGWVTLRNQAAIGLETGTAVLPVIPLGYPTNILAWELRRP